MAQVKARRPDAGILPSDRAGDLAPPGNAHVALPEGKQSSSSGRSRTRTSQSGSSTASRSDKSESCWPWPTARGATGEVGLSSSLRTARRVVSGCRWRRGGTSCRARRAGEEEDGVEVTKASSAARERATRKSRRSRALVVARRRGEGGGGCMAGDWPMMMKKTRAGLLASSLVISCWSIHGRTTRSRGRDAGYARVF